MLCVAACGRVSCRWAVAWACDAACSNRSIWYGSVDRKLDYIVIVDVAPLEAQTGTQISQAAFRRFSLISRMRKENEQK